MGRVEVAGRLREIARSIRERGVKFEPTHGDYKPFELAFRRASELEASTGCLAP